MTEYPAGLTAMLLAVGYWLGPTQEIVVAATAARQSARHLVAEIRRHFLPRATVAFRGPAGRGDEVSEIVPLVAHLRSVSGRPTVYVCEDYARRQPVTTVDGLRNILTAVPGTN